MPNKLIKWGVKIWCLANSLSRYIWDINVYQGADKKGSTVAKLAKDEAQQGMNVVRKLVGPLVGQDHIVIMDDFFTSMDLLENLEKKTNTP